MKKFADRKIAAELPSYQATKLLVHNFFKEKKTYSICKNTYFHIVKEGNLTPQLQS